MTNPLNDVLYFYALVFCSIFAVLGICMLIISVIFERRKRNEAANNFDP